MAHVKLRKQKSSHRRRQLIVSEPKKHAMPDVTYEIVQHDGGWAYKVNGAFRKVSRRMPRPSSLRNRPRRSRKYLGTPKRLNTRMTKATGTPKLPEAETARTL